MKEDSFRPRPPQGPSKSTAPDSEDAIGSRSRDPSDPPVDRGKRAETFEGDDEQQVAEEMVKEGLEEAEDDQERAARRKREDS
jgi:hypothetical protein